MYFVENYDDNINKLLKNKYKFFGLIALYLAVGVVFFSIVIKQTDIEYEEFRHKYKNIERFDSLSGTVSSISCRRGASVVSLSKGNNITFPSSRNYDYDVYHLCEFITVGDSIQKRTDCDTLYLFREKQEFYFVLGEIIGER